MEIGQSPVGRAYIQPTPEPVERRETPRQEALESNQTNRPQAVSQTSTSNEPPAASSGSVGRNIDTYA